MRRKIKGFMQKTFVKNVMIMATGTVSAQILNMLFTPIITRLYGPEAYGVMGAFLAVTSIVSPIAALTFPVAIVLPKRNKEAIEIVKLSLSVTIIISIGSFLMLILFKNPLLKIFNLNTIESYLLLIPLVILFSGAIQIMEQWLIRTSQFSVSAKVTFYQAVLMNGGKTTFGLFHPTSSILIIITAFGQAIKVIMLSLFIRNSSNLTNVLNEKLGLGGLIKLFKKYKDFPLLRSPQVLLNATTHSIPVLLLANLFGIASAGFYTLGRTVMSIPVTLLGKSVGDVFYPKITSIANNKHAITKTIERAVAVLFLIGIFPFGIVFFFGPELFSYVFGSEWTIAGDYARWLSIWLFTMLIYQPCIRAFPIMSAQGFHLVFTILSLIINVLSLSISYIYFKDSVVSIACFSIMGAFLNILLIVFTIYKSKRFDVLNTN